MATATKTKNYPPNDVVRREKTRKAGRCQRCGTKVDLKDQKSLVRTEDDHIKIVKAKDGLSHYCDECARGPRFKEKTRGLEPYRGETWDIRTNGSGSKASGRKAAAKAKPKAGAKRASGKAKAAKPKAKRVVKKRAAKVSAASEVF